MTDAKMTLVGFINNDILNQQSFTFLIKEGKLTLMDLVLSFDKEGMPAGFKMVQREVNAQQLSKGLILECPSYSGDGIRFIIDPQSMTGMFSTGLHSYSSGSSGCLEPNLLKMLLDAWPE